MNRKDQISKITRDPETQILLAHIMDLYEKARDKNCPACTSFLSPQECRMAQDLLQGYQEMQITAFGGYEGAERKMLFFVPEYRKEIPKEISVIRTSWYREDQLTHRDLLGALMGLGIERKCTGDILVSKEKHSADILTTRCIAPYLLENYQQAGYVKLHCQEVPLQHLHMPQPDTKEVRDTVASLRLDSVLSSAFQISRTRAGGAIASGKVQVNWKDVAKVDYILSSGDTITCRGLGKAELAATGNLTKKGRISICIKRYL